MTQVATRVENVDPMTMSVTSLQHLFREGLEPQREKWTLVGGVKRKLDLANHVLRVILQLELVAEYVDEFDALLACQKDDGSWGEASTDDRHAIREHHAVGHGLQPGPRSSRFSLTSAGVRIR